MRHFTLRMGSRLAAAVLAGALFFTTIGPAAAQVPQLPQFVPAYPLPYVPGTMFAPPPVSPYGGYLSGVANVINARGQYLVNAQQANVIGEQANLMKERVKSAQVDNRLKAFNEALYEKSVTDCLNARQATQQQAELNEALGRSTLTDVWSGQALNTLMARIQTLQKQGAPAPNVALDASVLGQINVVQPSGAVSCQARGATVAQLGQFMTENHLQFAPSQTGEEGAYSALYRTLTECELAATPPAAPAPLPG